MDSTLHLSLLLSGAFGFTENLYIQLQDCCTYKDQGIIFIIDRENADYAKYKTGGFQSVSALGITLVHALSKGKSSIIVVSKSLLALLVKVFEGAWSQFPRPYNGWNVKEVQDFYLLTYSGLNFLSIDSKLNQLKNVSWDDVRHYIPELKSKLPLTDVFSEIFITRQEKNKNASRVPITAWMTYMVGHGLTGLFISGLPIAEFKNVLDYSEQKINTKIFIYNSCFAGGINKNLAFEKDIFSSIKTVDQKSYPFPIVVTSSFESSTRAFSQESLLFDKMFELLSADTSLDYYHIFSSAHLYSSGKATQNNPEIQVSNVPQVRLPGLATFSLDLLKNSQVAQDFVIISKVQAQTRTKELRIKETTKAVFLYAPVVPFTLTFPSTFNSSVRFVCMDSSDVCHLHELNAPAMNFEDLCKIFAPLSDVKKITFNIDKLTFKEENTDKSNVFYDVTFSLFPDSSSTLFKFKLVSAGVVFSAETEKSALIYTTIVLKNVDKKIFNETSYEK